MRAVLNFQLGYPPVNNPTWRERIPFYGTLSEWFSGPANTPPPHELWKWQNQAYLQIHRLAQRVNAEVYFGD